MRALAVLPILVPFALASACGNPFLVHDTFTEEPEGLFAQQPNELHDYVVGARFGIRVRAARSFVNLDEVEIVSKDPSLLVVEEQVRVEDRIHAQLRAIAPGTTGLDFLDAVGRPLEERVLEVKIPDDIALTVNMDTDLGYTIPVLDPDDFLLAKGGVATFRVAYLSDGEEIKGNDVLDTSPTSIGFENPTRAEPDREFLTLRAAADDDSDVVEVPLIVAGETIRTMKVQPTPLEDIASIELDEGTVPTFRGEGERSTIWAKAFNDSATPIFGAPFAWTLESAAVDGDGDLVTYAYAPGERRRIQVSSGDVVEDVTVEAAAASAQVSSTSNVGCASLPGAPLAFALLLLARRRVSRSGNHRSSRVHS